MAGAIANSSAGSPRYAVHAAAVAAAIFVIQTPEAFPPGSEEATPVEVIIAGTVDSAASNEGARQSNVAVDAPLPPETPPVEIKVAQVEVPLPPDAPTPEVAVPAVEVPLPPDASPLEVAALPTEIPPTPGAAPLLIEPPPEAQSLAPELIVPPPAATPVAETPPKPENLHPPARPVEKPKLIEEKAPAPKRTEHPKPAKSRKVAVRTPEKPKAETEPKPAQAAQGRGASGAGESDRNRAATTQGSQGLQGAGGGAAAVASYRAQVMAHLARFKVYPEEARERGVTGRAIVAFTLTRAGQVASASLAGSSGAPILDQATLAMVRRAAPFPAAPDGAAAVASFSAAINYNLR